MNEIDANAIARIAGVPTPTFNAWVQRGLLPGIGAAEKGKPRKISYKTGLRIMTMAQLVDIGFSPSFSAMAAAEAERLVGIDTPGARLIIGPPQKNIYGLNSTPTIDCVVVKGIKDLDAFIDNFKAGRPATYTIAELDRVAERVKAIFHPPTTKKAVKTKASALVEA